VYLDAPEEQPGGGVEFAVHALAAFDRIQLAAGESREMTLHVPLRSLEYWSAGANRWILAAGPRSVRVGASSRDFRLQAMATIEP
jgi:beta-glucosidase